MAERLADSLEIYGPYNEATTGEPAGGCVQWPDPVCVTGRPLSNRIPEWLGLTADGHFSEVATRLHSTGNLPEISSRVCASERQCEASCVLSEKVEPVSIRTIEIPAYCDFLALGFEAVLLPQEDPLPAWARDCQDLVAVEDIQMTSLPGVFAGGDLVRGSSTGLEAVRDARRAAQGIEAHLANRLK